MPVMSHVVVTTFVPPPKKRKLTCATLFYVSHAELGLVVVPEPVHPLQKRTAAAVARDRALHTIERSLVARVERAHGAVRRDARVARRIRGCRMGRCPPGCLQLSSKRAAQPAAQPAPRRSAASCRARAFGARSHGCVGSMAQSRGHL